MSVTTNPTSTTVALDIGGMTCASCAARITKRLNKLDGVEASVNYATEQATVTVPDGIERRRPRRPGRSHRLHGNGRRDRRRRAPPAEDTPEDDPKVRALRHRLIGAIVLGVPVLLLSMINTAAVHQLAVAHLGAGRPGRAVGRLAVPPRRLDEPAPRRRDRWTPSSPSAPSPRSAGASTPCSGARPARPA